MIGAGGMALRAAGWGARSARETGAGGGGGAGGAGGAGGGGDPFVLGKTCPTAALTGPRVALNELTPDSGVITLATPGQIYERRLLDGRIVVKAPNVVVRDCVIRMPASTTDIRGIFVATSGATGVSIEHNRIEVPAANRSFYQGYGIQGSGFTASRNDISGTVDGISMAGVNQRSFAIAKGNFIHGLVHYDNPPDTSHADGSHNDCIQVEGNLTSVSIIGNSLHAGHTSAVLVTQDNGTYDAPPELTDNCFYIEDASAGSILNVKSSMTPISGLAILRNRFTRDLPAKARMILYPGHLAVANITATGTDKNRYDTGDPADVVPVWNGQKLLYGY